MKLNEIWAESEIPIEYGLHEPPDSVRLAELGDNGRYTFGPSQREPSEETCFVRFSAKAENAVFTVLAGETTWESDAFIALLNRHTQELVWLLHLNELESPRQVEFEGDNILVTTEEYPFANKAVIPINDPASLTVDRRKIN